MRYYQTVNNLITALLVLAAGGLAIAWIVDPDVFGSSWFVRAGSLAVLLAAVGGVVGLLAAGRAHEQAAVQRYVDRLCQMDHRSAAAPPLPQGLGSLTKRGPWKRILNRISECIDAYQRRVDDAEHARASAEVRVRQLTSQCQQMSEILAGLPDPVLAIDPFDELVLANASAEALLHIDAQRAEERALDRLIQCQELVQLLTETRRRKLPARRTGEITIANGAGQRRCYRVTCTGIAPSADGRKGGQSAPHGAVAVLSDISNEKAIQQRNAEFVSAVSHEMKTPLAGIKAYVELLADGDAEDEATREEFLEVINSQADRLQRLIDNLLNLARIEAGVVDVNKQPRSLNELLEEALGVVQPAAESKPIRLVSDLSPMYLAVLADRDMLLQTAINLLSNAIKYTPEGGTVTLRSRMQDDEVLFEVEDTGVGLSEEDRQRVFQKFYRVKKDRQMASGTGLGLPLAKHIVEDVHGGSLTVDSRLGEGSTFRVTLPSLRQMKGRQRP